MGDSGSVPPYDPAGVGRLDSWKEIAAYLNRGVTTVQRWERTEGLPVHRLAHAQAGSVYAYRHELDEWWQKRSARLAPEAHSSGEEGPRSGRRWPRLAAAAALAVAGLGIGYVALSQGTGSRDGRVMLAVLPFNYLGEDEGDDYLADGVAEELITVLARLSPEHLAVIARTSVLPYRTQVKPIRDVARELGVDYVVEGSLRRSGSRVRIIAQLIDADDETHVWAEVYERELSDILRVEAEIAESIARRLSLHVLPDSLPRPPPLSAEASEAYLRGLHFWNKRDERSLRRAIELFRAALALEPGYARAHASLATTYALLATSADALDAGEARALAEGAARRALELDPHLPEGHAALAVVRCRFDWNWAECERELRTTLELNPSYASGRHWLGEFLLQRGRFSEAEAELRRARSLDPLSATICTHLGIAQMYARQWPEALASFDRALELDPRLPLALRVRGLTLVRSGRLEDGLDALRQARAQSPTATHAAADLGYALARAGREAEAQAILRELEQLSATRRVSAYDFALVQVGLGQTDAALSSLEKAYAERATGVRWLKIEPIFDPLRGDPRFEALLSRLGLPD